MTVLDQSRQSQCAIGIDVGGTKCAAGLIQFPKGHVLARRLQPTQPERGGAAVLDDIIKMVCSLQGEAAGLGVCPTSIGLGVAELVSIDGQVMSEATIRWKGVPVGERLRAETRLSASVDADVRAAARGEAYFGAGRPFRSFLYVTVGTGISASFVLDRVPSVGARGLTGTFASSRGLIPSDDGNLVSGPPLEAFSAGPALAARFAAAHPNFLGMAHEVVALATAGDSLAQTVVATAAEALGAAIGYIVNVLDPEAVVIGGGLGMVGGLYRESVDSSLRAHVWCDYHREIPLLSAELGNDAGFIGAALAAAYIDPPDFK
jgi:glucokinase